MEHPSFGTMGYYCYDDFKVSSARSTANNKIQINDGSIVYLPPLSCYENEDDRFISIYKDIDELADNAIVRMNDYGYHLRDIENRTLVFLIHAVFIILKKINHGNPPTEKILLIHRDFNKYMYGDESPVVSPVPSPEATPPKIMKKEKRKKKKFFQ